jgi:hypothetical protein
MPNQITSEEIALLLAVVKESSNIPSNISPTTEEIVVKITSSNLSSLDIFSSNEEIKK